MADRNLDTKGTDSPLAGLEAVIGVILPCASDQEPRSLARKTLPGHLGVCSVGGHALSETTVGTHADTADLLKAQSVYNVTDRSLLARHRRRRGVFGEGLDGGGGVVGLARDLRLLRGQLSFPDDVANDSSGSVAAVLELLGDERGQDVRVELWALEFGQVELDGLAVHLRQERLERSLRVWTEEVDCQTPGGATSGSC